MQLIGSVSASFGEKTRTTTTKQQENNRKGGREGERKRQMSESDAYLVHCLQIPLYLSKNNDP